MTPADRLSAIAEQALCVGCGICESIAGAGSVHVTRTTIDELRPVVVGDLSDEDVDTIHDVCPGTRVDGLPERLVDDVTTVDNVWGPWRRIVRAWAADPTVRHEGSTGGVLTALAQYLLASGRVAFVLHARASTANPTFGERTISFTEADALEAAGSRYGPTATLVDIDEVLDRDEPFAFIGKPCDIGALRNLARHDDRVDRLVEYWLTLVCGGYGPAAFTHGFLDRVGVYPDDVTAFRYRGRGCPGPTVVETAERTVEAHYLDYWGDDESQWSLLWRCKICPDGIGEAADLAAADTWVGGSPDRHESAIDPGTNAVIARTAVGVELLESAASDGALVIEHDIVPDDLSSYQPHQVRKKYTLAGRFAGIADEDRIVPTTRRLHVAQLAAEMPVAVSERQRRGTRERIRVGKASEPRPEPHPLRRRSRRGSLPSPGGGDGRRAQLEVQD